MENGAAVCNRTLRREVVGTKFHPLSLHPAIIPLAKPNRKQVSKGMGGSTSQGTEQGRTWNGSGAWRGR